MPDLTNPLEDVAEIIEDVAESTRDETLAGVAAVEQAAQLDRIEDALEAVEEHTPETPVTSPLPHEHPEIMGKLTDLEGSIARLGEAAAEVAEAAVEPVADVAEDAGEAGLDVAESAVEAVETAPKRTHLLFKKWFGR